MNETPQVELHLLTPGVAVECHGPELLTVGDGRNAIVHTSTNAPPAGKNSFSAPFFRRG